MTEPPYECPTRTTGPETVLRYVEMTAASASRPRSVFGSARTSYPSLSRRSTTPFQLEESAQAPWTSKIVGFITDLRNIFVLVQSKRYSNDHAGRLTCFRWLNLEHQNNKSVDRRSIHKRHVMKGLEG